MRLDSKKLFGLMVESQLSRQELARKTGINPKTLSQALKGTNIPHFTTLNKIAKTLNIKPQELLAEE